MVRAGEVFFFNPFEVHAANSGREPVDYETLYPTNEFIEACLGKRDKNAIVNIQTDVISRTRLTRELAEALSGPTTDRVEIEEALRSLIQICKISTCMPEDSSAFLVRKTCKFIKSNYPLLMRTEDLAEKAGVHKSHFVRTFKNATGLTPQKYIRQVRVAKARDLISNGSVLSEVAQMVGFCDQAHLTREFKKVFGVPPGRLSRHIAVASWISERSPRQNASGTMR